MREGSREPGRGECCFVVEKTFRTRPIDHESLGRRLEAYASACPGASLEESLLAVAFPPPIRGLLADWRPDWRTSLGSASPRRRWAVSAGDRPMAEAQPWTVLNQRREGPVEERFAWIKAHSKGFHNDDNESHKEDILQAWRDELASQGVATARWSGSGLQMINNGIIIEQAQASSRQECLDAMLAIELHRELSLAPKAKPPRL